MGVKDLWPFMKKRFPSACAAADGPTDATHVLLDASTLIYAGVKGAREPSVVWSTAERWLDEVLRYAPDAVEVRAEFDTRGAPVAKIVGRGPEKPAPFVLVPKLTWNWGDAEVIAEAIRAVNTQPKDSSSHFHMLMADIRDTAAWPTLCTVYHAHMAAACLRADPRLRILMNGTRAPDPPAAGAEPPTAGRGRMFGAGGLVPRDIRTDQYFNCVFYGGRELGRRPYADADPDGEWAEGDAKITRDLVELLRSVGAPPRVLLYSIDGDVLIRAVLALNAAVDALPPVQMLRSLRNGEFELWNVNELLLEMKKIGSVETFCKLLLLNGNDFMSHPNQYSLPRIFAPYDALGWLPVTDDDWVAYQFMIEANLKATEADGDKVSVGMQQKLAAAREIVSNTQDLTAAAHLGLRKKPVPAPRGTGKRYKPGGVPDGFADEAAAAAHVRAARTRRLQWTFNYFAGARTDEFSADWGYGKNESGQLVENEF